MRKLNKTKLAKIINRSTLAVLTVALSHTGYAVAENYSGLAKEIEIVKGIVDTSLKQQQRSEGIRYRSLDAMYLAGQGVVFTVSSTGNGNWMSRITDIVDRIPPIPPVPDVPAIVSNGEIDIELSREWEAFADETASRFGEAFAESTEQMYDLRSEEREIAWERRDIERRKRDLEFEAGQADKARAKAIKDEVDTLEKELAALSSKEGSLRARRESIEQQRQESADARKQAQLKAAKAFLSNFEAGIGEALCRFGGGMRALPDDEHVTFVLKGFVQGGQSGQNDKVYVFKKSKIEDCVKEKLNTDGLLNSANVYDF